MLSLGERVAVTESLNRDVTRFSMWSGLCGINVNASKTKTMIVSRSRTIHRQSTTLILDGTLLTEFAGLVHDIRCDVGC